MRPETVARLKAYVEAGGTFVALQETGRHTPLERDAWPISDLTGFKVSEIRPMTGTVNILHDQPLFTALAGKSFLNQGSSVDYSSYNYADKCVALEPVAADTQAIARYGDGAIAIGMRKLGKGRVVVLGSPFWRDSYDKGGTWWPGEGQSVFLEDIFHGLGPEAGGHREYAQGLAHPLPRQQRHGGIPGDVESVSRSGHLQRRLDYGSSRAKPG